MTSKEVHAAGYAIPAYNINNDVRSWRIGDERVIDLPAGAVPLREIDGFKFKVAKIEDVLAAHAGMKEAAHG